MLYSLIWLLFFVGVLYVAKLIVDNMGLPEKALKIAYLIGGLIALLILFSRFGLLL